METNLIGPATLYRQYVTIPRVLVGWQHVGFTLVNSDPIPASLIETKYSRCGCGNCV